jgi:2-dehydro-3-deoxygluconokinase
MKRIVGFGEILLRLGAPGHEPLLRSPTLEAAVGGAEANVCVALAALGVPATVVSVLPEGPVGDACCGELRRHGVDASAIRREPGRLGLYFMTRGAGLRASQVTYDRAGSAFALADPDRFDWSRLLTDASVLHLTGITLALGECSVRAARAAADAALARGAMLSFDCNFRPSLWRGRELEATALFGEFARRADVLFAGAPDGSLLFGVECDGSDGVARFEQLRSAAFAQCPRLCWLAGSARVAHGADRHDLTGYVVDRDRVHASRRLELTGIVDRIGGGDAFAAGVLYGLVQSLPAADTAEFAITLAALKHSVPGDFVACSSADVRIAMAAGERDVRR